MNPSLITRLVPLLLAGLPMTACAADWQALLDNSPFGQTTAASPTATGDLEFRGVVQEEGVYFVNLYNPTTKTSQWIEVNGKVPGLEVQAYDAGSDKVQIMQAGRSLTLPLKQARVALVAAVAAPVAAANPNARDNPDDRRNQIRDMVRARLEGGPGGPNGGTAPLIRNLPPEAQAMIEEFRRRRAQGAAGGQGPEFQGQNVQVQGQQIQIQGQNQGQRNRRDRP
jgi:hypothetical protein